MCLGNPGKLESARLSLRKYRDVNTYKARWWFVKAHRERGIPRISSFASGS